MSDLYPFAASESLPPMEYWLVDPFKDGRIPTPVDSVLGIVDVPRLIADVMATVAPEYSWMTLDDDGHLILSKHHILWPYNMYTNAFYEGDWQGDPRLYRSISPNIAIVPRVFENWVHLITEPAPLADEEVRREAVSGWISAHNMYESASDWLLWMERSENRQQQVLQNPSILPVEFNGVDIIGRECIKVELDAASHGLEIWTTRHDEVLEACQHVSVGPEEVCGVDSEILALATYRITNDMYGIAKYGARQLAGEIIQAGLPGSGLSVS